MGDKKFSTLALGTRQDAGTWDKGCASVGLDQLTSIRDPSPDMDDLKAFFAQTPDWLYLGGHFGSLQLMNDALLDDKKGAVDIKFSKDHVTINIDGAKEKLSRADDTFQLHKNVVVILWGGCSVCDTTHTMRTLRTLFDQHVLLGFAGTTGVAMVDAMLGNGHIKDHFFKNVKGNTGDLDAVAQAWMKAALAGYGNGWGHERFRAIDFDGQGWKLEDGKIKKWDAL